MRNHITALFFPPILFLQDGVRRSDSRLQLRSLCTLRCCFQSLVRSSLFLLDFFFLIWVFSKRPWRYWSREELPAAHCCLTGSRAAKWWLLLQSGAVRSNRRVSCQYVVLVHSLATCPQMSVDISWMRQWFSEHQLDKETSTPQNPQIPRAPSSLCGHSILHTFTFISFRFFWVNLH